MRAHGDDRGSGTVLVTLVGLVVASVVLASVAVGAAIIARHRAMSGADLAALAAAQALARGAPDPCEHAARVAHRQAAALLDCSIDGLVADVTVAVVLPAPWGAGLRATMRSRAGPAAPGLR